MKQLDLASVSPSNGFPVKVGTINFLQLAYTEIVSAMAERMLNSPYAAFTPYVLFGCKYTSSGGNTTISQGAIFYNGEVLLSPSQTFADASGGNVIIANIGVTQYTTNADAVQFTGGGAPINVHNIRQVLFSTAGTGTGNIGDYSTFINLTPSFLSTFSFYSVGPIVMSNYGSGYNNVKYRIYDDFVEFSGVVTCANIAAGNIPILSFFYSENETIPGVAECTTLVKQSTTYAQLPVYISQTSTVISLTLRSTYASGTLIIFLDNLRFRIK